MTNKDEMTDEQLRIYFNDLSLQMFMLKLEVKILQDEIKELEEKTND